VVPMGTVKKPQHGSWPSLGLGFSAALLAWTLAIGMFAVYLVVALEYDHCPRINCLRE